MKCRRGFPCQSDVTKYEADVVRFIETHLAYYHNFPLPAYTFYRHEACYVVTTALLSSYLQDV